jgi:hypothetical protein
MPTLMIGALEVNGAAIYQLNKTNTSSRTHGEAIANLEQGR